MIVGIASKNLKNFLTNLFGFVLIAKVLCDEYFNQPVLFLRARAGTSPITNDLGTVAESRLTVVKRRLVNPIQRKLIPRPMISLPRRLRVRQVSQLNQQKRHHSFVIPHHYRFQLFLPSHRESRIFAVLQRMTCACRSGCRVCGTPFLR